MEPLRLLLLQENISIDSIMKKYIILIIMLFISALSFSKETFLWRYMVEPGDTLYRISRFFATRPDILVKRNGLTNPEKLDVGQFMDIFVPYVETNMIFEKSSDGCTLKSQKFVLLKNLRLIFKTLNEPEYEYKFENENNYFGKVKVEVSTSHIFKLSVLLNVMNPVVERFFIEFEIPTISFYMSTMEVFFDNTNRSEKFVIGEGKNHKFSNIKRLKMDVPDGSFNFVFYGGDINLDYKGNKLMINVLLELDKDVGIYRTQMAVFLQEK